MKEDMGGAIGCHSDVLMKSVFWHTTFRFNKAGINEILFQKECTEGVEVGFVLGEFKRTLLMHAEILLYDKQKQQGL